MVHLFIQTMTSRKVCTKCNTEKDLSAFNSMFGRDGVMRYQSWCRDCMSIYLKVYRKHYRACVVDEHVCDIIKKHHEEMKGDPEHLTTEFMQKMIGSKC